MIALIIIPLKWADPDSRKVLVPDESCPSERFAGEDGEGFYSVVQARMNWEVSLAESSVWRNWLSNCVTPSGLPLYTVACVGSQNVGVYIEHFSAPSDYDNHFVETPLIAVPEPEPVANTYDPETHVWSVGDWFEVVSDDLGDGDLEFVEVHGRGPFQVTDLFSGWICSHGWGVSDLGVRGWDPDEILPCPALHRSFLRTTTKGSGAE
jgi:hypothetical protein